MPLFVAGYGRLQQGIAHLATAVALLQVVHNWPHKTVVVGSPLGGAWLYKILPFKSYEILTLA